VTLSWDWNTHSFKSSRLLYDILYLVGSFSVHCLARDTQISIILQWIIAEKNMSQNSSVRKKCESDNKGFKLFPYSRKRRKIGQCFFDQFFGLVKNVSILSDFRTFGWFCKFRIFKYRIASSVSLSLFLYLPKADFVFVKFWYWNSANFDSPVL